MSWIMTIDQSIEETISPVSTLFSSVIFYELPVAEGISLPLILLWIVSISLFTTFYFGFVNLRYFAHGIRLAMGIKKHPHDKHAQGQISPFQALAANVSGTVGLGNIAGVAVAISIGGPGAVFWMVMMGLFSMAVKFQEAALGVHYRVRNHHGTFSGGPMYYLRDGLAEMGMKQIGMILAVMFAICTIGGAIGAGNMFQANQVHQQIVNVTGGAEASYWADKGWIFGLILAVLVGVVIIGGIRSIAAVAEKIVPTMAGLYLLSGLIVLIVNIHNVPAALSTIFSSAFSTEAGLGGLIGAIIQGVRRAAFSNEAAIGTGGIVHAPVKTSEPIGQGMVAMLGTFVDTVVICLMTALVIVVSGIALDGNMEGVSLTSQAFSTVMPWYPYVLAFIVFLFAYSTMLTYFYVGSKGVEFLFGDHRLVDATHKLIYLAAIVVGASTSLSVIIDLSDAMYFAMAIPNVIGLYLLAPKIRRALNDYCGRISR